MIPLKSKDLKYVLNEDTLQFVIFPPNMNHSDIPGKWTGAGMIYFGMGETDKFGQRPLVAACHGKSVSLNLVPGPNDSRIITTLIQRR